VKLEMTPSDCESREPRYLHHASSPPIGNMHAFVEEDWNQMFELTVV
jgi:hypothetical protein